jgi:hypothetical protein
MQLTDLYNSSKTGSDAFDTSGLGEVPYCGSSDLQSVGRDYENFNGEKCLKTNSLARQIKCSEALFYNMEKTQRP